MAHLLLRRLFAERGIDVKLVSAGFGPEGLPPNAETVLAAESLGIDLTGWRSRRLTAHQLQASDMVIGMEAGNVRDVVALHAGSWPKTFTLIELVRRAETLGARPADLPMTTWVERLNEDRRPTDLLRVHPGEQVPDPMGGPLKAYLRTALLLDDRLRRFVALAYDREASWGKPSA